MNQKAARNALNRRATAESLVQVEVNQDTARAVYTREMTTALQDAVVSKPTPQQVTDDGLTSMTVLTSDVVPQNPDAVAERIQLQMENLAQTAQVQMQEVQNAQMAQIIERRTQLAIQALAQQLSAAQIRRFKAEFAKALAADIVIGAILNQTLLDLNTVRDANVRDTGNYNVADPTTDLNSSETKVMQDVYALMTAIFISRGSVSELTDTLTQSQIEMNALTTQLQNLMNEGGDLINLEVGVSQIVTNMSQAVDNMNAAVNALKASLQSINDTINSSTFLLDSEYTDYVALKGYVDSQIGQLQGIMNGLQTYLGGINISADLAEIQRQKDLQATKLGVFRDALQTVSTDPAGAQGVLDTARTEYGVALGAINQTGPTLTAAAAAVPGISELTTERGATPTQPAATAPSVQTTLLGETPKLQVPLGTVHALKDSVNTLQVTIDSYGQIVLTSPLGSLLLEQSELRDVIQTLALLMQRPSTTFMTGLDTYLQGLYASMTAGRMAPVDRGPLDAANYDLSKLRGDMATTETTRRGYVMNVLTISARTSNNTERLLMAQMFLDRLTIRAKIEQLDLSAPVKPTTSDVVTASMNASRMSSLLDSVRGELVVNLESQLQAKTNLALARNAAGKYAKFLETRELVTVTDAAAVVAASDGVTAGTGAVTTAVQGAQTVYTVLMNLDFARTRAERRLAKQEALRYLLGGRGTTYADVRTLDSSTPSKPSLAAVVNLAAETRDTTTVLEGNRDELILNVAAVKDSTAGLSLSRAAAGKYASFVQAQAVVASDGIAVTTLSGSVTTGTGTLTTAVQGAQTAKDVTAELYYTKTEAERDLSSQEGLRELLEDRETTYTDVRTLDSSTPSKPSLAVVVDLAAETRDKTTVLEGDRDELILNVAAVRDSTAGLSLSQGAAGNLASLVQAQAVVASDGIAVTTLSGSVTTGTTAVTTAVQGAQTAKDVTAELYYTKTEAERDLSRQEGLRDLLGDRQTTDAGVRTLDSSTPSKPSLVVVVNLANETRDTTTDLGGYNDELILNLAAVRDSIAGLSLSQGAAGNLASLIEAQAVVASDRIAITALSGSVTTATVIVTVAVRDAQTAQDVTIELHYTRTKAERDLSSQEGLRDLLEDRETTYETGTNLDLSTPSKPSFAVVVDLATETSRTTTNLEEQGRQAVIIRVRIRGTVGNLDLAGNAAGKYDQFVVAGQFVAAAGVAIIVAQGNVGQGITAVSDATTAASSAFTEMNLQYTTIQTVYIALTTVEGTIIYLQTTFIPNINIDLSAAKGLSDTTFTFLITRRLFPQSLSIFGVSTSDLRGYYANKMQIKLSISDSINTDSLQDSEGDIAVSITTINDNKTAIQTISASLDGLKAELASLGLTDISVYTIIPNTLDAQNLGLDTIADSADALSGATTAMNTAAANLSDSASALADGKQFIQALINTNVALSNVRMRLVLVSTVQSEKNRLTQLSQSQQDTMDTAREAAAAAGVAAADTPAKPDTSAVQGLQAAKAALDPNEMGNTERLLQIYNDMKNDPSFINGRAELEQFFQGMGTTYDMMQDAKMRLIEQLSDLQYEAVVLDTARARMAELQALLEGAKGLDTSLILRNADIAKLMGEAAAYKAQQSTAKDAKENAALQADIDPSTTELMANIALLESLQQQYETLQNDTNTKEADLLDLQSRINALMQGMNGIDARTLLRNYQLKVALAESQRAALEARILAEKANQTVNVNALAQLTAELARLNAKIIALRNAIESITKLQTLKADILQNNPENSPADNNKATPPVSVNLSMFLKLAAGAAALALGGLAFYYLGPNNIGDMMSSDCNKGKKAAEDAIKENSMAVRQQANFAGLKWAKQNTTAGETSAVPTLPDAPAEEEAPPPIEEEPTPPTDEEPASTEANGDTGSNEVMSGGDSSYAIPQEKEVNEAEGAEDAEGAEGAEGAEDEQGATGDTGPQAEEGDEGSSFSAPGIPQKGTREQLTSDDTQIPQSILDKIYAKYLVPPMVLKYTYGKAPSAQFISCFKKKVETELGGMWTSAFTAGANGMSLFDFSGLLGELLGSAATAVTSQGNQETATNTGDTGDTGTTSNSTTDTTGAQGDREPSYAERQEQEAAYQYY